MDDIRDTFKRFRSALNKSKDDSEYLDKNTDYGNKKADNDAKAYTRQDELMKNAISSAKSQFGADFSNFKTPMLYYPNDGDVTLSGEIPLLNGAKFQFRYRDPSGNGCYIWVNSLVLSDNNILTLNRILGMYENWKKELSQAEDIKPMNFKDENDD